MSFRSTYKLISKQAVHWFPGHMGKGLKQMQQRLKMVDCVVEVHDARIPFSGRNPEFEQTITGGDLKPHVLVLNKKDLVDRRDQRKVENELKNNGIKNIIFTNCKNQQCQGTRELLPKITELIVESDRYNRRNEKDYNVMVIGVPNVGKSSLLNVLRNKNLGKKSAAAVGAEAGITRSVLEKIKICEAPLTYMIDTPGILEPRVTDDEMGMKLALVGCFPDHIVGIDQIADYLLYWLNKHNKFEYVEVLGLKNATDHIAELLFYHAKNLGKTRKIKRYDGQVITMPDMLYAAQNFVQIFRKGEFGHILLDKV
ncbi:mitochondrial GTPase 1-like [Teleopsis dalmanni]|uniref:mitochondrial GTPase 1 n=1 Tax=Teleopsis dalmanni TaxID=139649 RepID=UPI0018CEACC4|nr:mitochondrial GTPase 1 [Teleopsis dalmanni]XP_037948728.1 mitochondrial GTPase 1-like [Teleopsis dalmanni]